YNFSQTSLTAEFTIPYRYEIHFTKDLFDLNNRLISSYFSEQKLTKVQIPKIVFMVDQGVSDYHPDLVSRIKTYFAGIPHVSLIDKIYIFPGGELIKNNRDVQEDILQTIDRHGIDRHSYVAAMGGGAFLDAVGYASSISHRGVRHIRIPTTVLSQNDSGIGVKNGINYFHKKNYFGSYSPAEAVCNDFAFLQSLSDRDELAGLAEAAKVSFIKDHPFFHWIEQNT